MTNDRRSHQCHATGCDSEAKFETAARILCRSPGLPPIPVKMASSIKVCARHAIESDVRRYLTSPHNREVITTGLMEDGHPEPDFLSLVIEFKPMTAEHSVLQAAPSITKCMRHECSKVAHWQVEQHFRMLWQRGKGKYQIKVLSNICVCDEHKATLKPADFQDKASEASTRAWLNAKGVSMPDFKTMAVGFVPLERGKPQSAREWVGDNGPLDQFKPKADGA